MSEPTTNPYEGRGSFAGAWRKGYEAAQRGESKSANPYGDQRTYRGAVTFARGFWKAWNRGHDDGGSSDE